MEFLDTQSIGHYNTACPNGHNDCMLLLAELFHKDIVSLVLRSFKEGTGFRTSSEYGIFPVSGYPMTEPRCQMCFETYPGSLKGKCGYVVYDMYYNA